MTDLRLDHETDADPTPAQNAEPMPEPKYKVVCDHCGSDSVLINAFVQWDELSQDWHIVNTFDKGSHCDECEGECRTVEVAID